MVDKWTPKLARCILHTASITAEQLQAANEIGEMTPEDVENWLLAYKEFDGAKVILMLEGLCPGDGYHLMGRDDDQDEKVMMGFYYAEQDSMMGTYHDDLEQFKKDWKNKDYEAECSPTFQPENVEIIEEVNPEKGENHEKLSQ